MSNIKQLSSLRVYAVEDSDNTPHWLEMREIPLVGDTLIVENGEFCSVFRVKERGQIAGTKGMACGWIRLEEIEGRNHAPGSGYQFMEEFRKRKP